VSTAVGVAPAEDKDPDDDIELPEDVAKEENLIAMGMTCADLLNGHSCRESPLTAQLQNFAKRFKSVG
jgi:hypothetical protein